MQLYYSPGACSIGIHILLEEIGKPYETAKVALMEGEQYKPSFVAVNPKSKVPTLALDDGSVLTEYGAIAVYLARSFPEAKLLPEDTAPYVRAIEAMDYAVGTIHMQAFARQFRPGNFTPSEADQDAVRAKGREMAEKGYALLDAKLAGQEWIAGPYSIADSALFYVMFWGAKRMNIALPPNCAAHFARMLARPAVQRTLAAEGFA